jgi:peptide/nickel transport system substrate-binding protein
MGTTLRGWGRLAVMAGALAASVFVQQNAGAAEFRYGVSADVTSLDPQFANLPGNRNVARNVFEPLIDMSPDGRLQPGLAESWKPLDDKTWEIKLRKNVKFQDGSSFTADDVVYSLARPDTLTNSPATFGVFTKDITKVEVVDPYTVKLTTARPLAVLPNYLSMIFMLSKKDTQGLKSEDFETGKGLVGTGPYKFSRFLRGDRVELVRNDAYWGDKPAYDKVTVRILPNAAARVAAILSGDVDAVIDVPSADVARIKADKQLAVYTKPSTLMVFWVMNQLNDNAPYVTDNNGKPLGKNPFKDVRVRRAFSLAINRQVLVDRVLQGLGVATQNSVPSTMFGYNPALPPDPYKPDEAKKLLAEAGYPECFSLTLFAPNDRYVNDSQLAQGVAQMLTRIGCKTKVETQPMGTFISRVNQLQLGFFMIGWGADAGDMGVQLESLFSNPTNNPFRKINIQTYDSPKFWKPLNAGLATVDNAKREALYQETSKVLHDEVGIIPTHLQVSTFAARNGIHIVPRVDSQMYGFDAAPAK